MLPVSETTDEAIESIRTAPLDGLRSATLLEYEMLPALGLHEHTTLPKHLEPLRAKGVQSWQWPNQFGRYLANLADRKIDSYMELGISHGGTFIITNEYLRRFNPGLVSVGIDIEIKPGVKDYQNATDNITIIEANTRSSQVCRLASRRLWGLVLIDGDHSEEGCWADYQTVKEFAALVAFHDISNDVFPGVGAVWRKLAAILPRRRTFEFTEQYPDVIQRFQRVDYGIGLAQIG
jgi:cephalosporin hydroxylase